MGRFPRESVPVNDSTSFTRDEEQVMAEAAYGATHGSSPEGGGLPPTSDPSRTVRVFVRALFRLLKDTLSENLLLKGVALILAFSLWAMVSEEPDVESSFMVPLSLKLPPDLMLTAIPPQTVTVYVKGSRSKLKSIPVGDLELPVDFGNANSGEVRYAFDNARIRNLPAGVSVVGFSPASLVVPLEHRIVREVPVRIRKTGELAYGYRLISSPLSPMTVTVEGPRSVIESLTELKTQPVDLSERKKSSKETVMLQIDSPYLRVKGGNEKVTVTLNIEPIPGQRRFEDVSVVMPEALQRFTVVPNRVTVVLDGPKAVLDKLEEEDVQVSIQVESTDPGVLSELTNVRFDPRAAPGGVASIKVRLPDGTDARVRRISPAILELKSARADAGKNGRNKDSRGR